MLAYFLQIPVDFPRGAVVFAANRSSYPGLQLGFCGGNALGEHMHGAILQRIVRIKRGANDIQRNHPRSFQAEWIGLVKLLFCSDQTLFFPKYSNNDADHWKLISSENMSHFHSGCCPASIIRGS